MFEPIDGFFAITTLHRDDLADAGYDVSSVDDDTMAKLAGKMSEAYLEQIFWIDLEVIADLLGIPKAKKAD